MEPHPVGVALRQDDDPGVRRRRGIAALAGFAIADFLAGALYQTGVLERLPDPPLPGVDSLGVMASRPAYLFGIPDTPIAIAANAVTMALAAAGGTARTGRPPIADVALGGVAIAGAAGAAAYMVAMARQRRICVYCVAAATAMTAIVPLAWPGLRSGLRRWRRAHSSV